MRWAAWLVIVAACAKHDDVQHPAPPMRLDTPGPVAAAPPPVHAPAPIDWDRDLAYLPVDSELVVGVDLVQLRRSSLWAAYVPSFLAWSKFPDLRTRCGFDPIEAMTGTSLGLKNLDAQVARGAFVIHGLPHAQLAACIAKAPGAKVDGDVTIIHSSDTDFAAAFLDADTLLVVVGPGVARAELDAAKAGQSALPTSPAFLDLWKLADKHGSGWVLVNGTITALASLRGIAPDLKAIVGSIALTDRLAIDLRFRLGSAQTVATLAGIVKGQVAQVKQMFDRFDVTADSADVHLELAMTADQLDQVASMLQTPLVHRDAKGH